MDDLDLSPAPLFFFLGGRSVCQHMCFYTKLPFFFPKRAEANCWRKQTAPLTIKITKSVYLPLFFINEKFARGRRSVHFNTAFSIHL